MKTKSFKTVLALILWLPGITTSYAQKNKDLDALFPGRHKLQITAATGIPLKALGEVSFGISKGFSVGAFYGKGIGAGVHAIGIRPRGVFWRPGPSTRLYGELPIIFYPETPRSTREAWFLLFPGIMLEHKFPSGLRLAGGTGIVSVGCVDAIMGGHEQLPHHVVHSPDVFVGEDELMGAAWLALKTQASFPVSKHITLQTRADIIAAGLGFGEIQKKEWLYQIPLITVTGATYTF